jgi:predicted N-formylglutamate amidohydrolase
MRAKLMRKAVCTKTRFLATGDLSLRCVSCLYQPNDEEKMTTEHAFHILGHDRPSNLIVTCDHASNHVPFEVNGGDLGLVPAEMQRHIAYDVGAAGVSTHLGELLGAPVILSNFSRLVIDANRGEDDPTLVMKLYDGTLIPANRHIGAADLQWRLENCYRPYHAAYDELVASRAQPVIIAVHSFTAQLAGRPKRPWHVGILYGKDQRLAQPMLARLRAEADWCVGENEPYGGHLEGDSIDRHAQAFAHPNILIEIRNDLIRSESDQQNWAARLAPILRDVIATTNIDRGKNG